MVLARPLWSVVSRELVRTVNEESLLDFGASNKFSGKWWILATFYAGVLCVLLPCMVSSLVNIKKRVCSVEQQKVFGFAVSYKFRREWRRLSYKHASVLFVVPACVDLSLVTSYKLHSKYREQSRTRTILQPCVSVVCSPSKSAFKFSVWKRSVKCWANRDCLGFAFSAKFSG